MMFAGVFALVLPPRRRRGAALFGFFLFAALLTGIGCGGGSSNSTSTKVPSTPTDPGTSSGSYSVVVKGASGSITRSANVTVTVP
jgi:hypothetical protein